MKARFAINGFGRIGRLVLRALYESNRKDIQVVAINDLGSPESNAHLFKYDTVHGKFPGKITVKNNSFDIGLGAIKVFAEKNPIDLPWKKLNIDVVLECTGLFSNRKMSKKHITAGAKKVLISAPADEVDCTVVFGVNHKQLTKKHSIVSNASCTTNCLAPIVSVLHKTIGINSGYMTTIHSFTGDQRIVDTLHKDLYRARAASNSMIPTSTGAARAVGLVLPELKGKLDGTAIRVPTVNVSLIDFTFITKRNTSAKEINSSIKKATKNEFKNIIDINSEPLVSIDFCHNAHSSIFDTSQTSVVDKRFCRILSWYDNEWGFSNRMLDTASYLAKL
ncbi:MAG TPA: type I glyceraldehyde-3-phosphate dehydrogenase [Alphaproteobacteria bacterium]|nr:type I glyceraldehyde-3-phosphate dehydrogenase [Alphaproteobacteria bacterium]|tara:strand:+ start:2388 stop:3392 length:1005 start_codon:yes stop_codon:yes gene_type:complete